LQRHAGGGGLFWWGEATDEPARENARPTQKGKPTHYGADLQVDMAGAEKLNYIPISHPAKKGSELR